MIYISNKEHNSTGELYFPFSVLTWREIISLDDFYGVDYLLLDFNLIIFLFILPFILIIVLFRVIFVYKYTFKSDRIIAHYFFGFKKEIGKDHIFRILARNNETKLEIHWRKRKYSTTKRIIILDKSLRKLNLPINVIAKKLINAYLE